MTDIFYIEELSKPGIPYQASNDGPYPWHTDDITLARFAAYALNKHAGETIFQTKQYFGIPPLGYLDVPYMPQWGVGADERRGDCGPACIAMIVPFLTDENPTVNEAAEACGQPEEGSGSLYTNHAQLRKGAAAYGVTLLSRSPVLVPPLALELLEDQVDAGLPSIALIHYGVLRDETNKLPATLGYVRNQDQNYDRGHWVVFIGYDKKDVWIHDSDYWGAREQDGNARRVPINAFEKALKAVAPGCSVGFQGLVVGV